MLTTDVVETQNIAALPAERDGDLPLGNTYELDDLLLNGFAISVIDLDPSHWTAIRKGTEPDLPSAMFD